MPSSRATIDPSPYRENHTDVWLDLLVGIRSQTMFILLVFSITVFSTYLLMQMKTELYETGVSLLVKLGRENLEAPATVEKGSMVNTVGVRSEDISTEISLLLSRDLIQATVDSIGLDVFLAEAPPPETFFKRIKYYIKQFSQGVKAQVKELLVFLNLMHRLEDRERVIQGLQETIGAVPGKESDVINVYMRTPNPVLAEKVLATLLDLYLERRVQVRGNRNIRSFFGDQAKTFRDQIRDVEDTRSEILKVMGVSDIPVQRELLLKRLHILYAELEQYKGQYFLFTGGEKLRPEAEGNPLIDHQDAVVVTDLKPLKKRLGEMRIDRLALLQTYSEVAEPVTILDQEIAAVEHILLAALDARIEKWHEHAAALESQLEALNEAEIALQALDRQHTLAQQNYFLYDKRKEEARISEELDRRRVSNIAVMAPVSSSFAPVSPRKLLIMVISIPVGLLLGFGLALLLEYLNDRVRSYRDLLKIPGTRYLGEFHHNG